MENKILKPDQGISHDAFRPPASSSENTGDSLDSSANDKKEKDSLLDLQWHIYVPEVVREKKMHFYRVPRLGAFLAIPLEYNSCLTEKALD